MPDQPFGTSTIFVNVRVAASIDTVAQRVATWRARSAATSGQASCHPGREWLCPGACSPVGIGDARDMFQSSDLIDVDRQERQEAMWRLGRMLPLTILLVLSVLLVLNVASVAPLPGRVLAGERGTPRKGMMHVGAGPVGPVASVGALRALPVHSVNQLGRSVVAPHASFAPATAASTRAAMPSVVALTATPLQAAPLDTVTFATTFFNGGITSGPYRATLQLLPEHGDQLRSRTQSGFMLRHNRPLTLYWEWRAGAELPSGRYEMRVQLYEMCAQLGLFAEPNSPVASYTARQRLTIVPRYCDDGKYKK